MKPVAGPVDPLFQSFRSLALFAAVVVLQVPAGVAQGADTPQAAAGNDAPDASTVRPPPSPHDKGDMSKFLTESSSQYNYTHPQSGPEIVFFPPIPPPLGSDLPLLAPLESGRPAPLELAKFPNELFYPLLGTRLARSDLTEGLRVELEAYRAEKIRLQNELRAQMGAVKDADPKAAERQLAAFAESQAPRIADLETQADRLRADLGRTGVLGLLEGNNPMNVKQGGHAATMPADLRQESEYLRTAAFYQDGLSSAERRLLREAAIELRAEANPAQAEPPDSNSRLLYFSPDASRIWIPAHLPEMMESTIDEYVSDKKQLESELREALRSRSDSPDMASVKALRKLSESQGPRIAQVEDLAETIRRNLATLPIPPGPPAPPPLPPALSERISVYRQHKLELLKTLRSMLAAPTEAPPPREGPGNEKAADPTGGAMSWMHDGTSSTPVRPENLQTSVKEFDRKQAELIDALNKEQVGIREALSAYARATDRANDRKSINDLLKDFENARQKQEIWDKYRDYHAAVLVPGLSPAQRRLLFDAAVEQLALPLPAGEEFR
jgi:hypothetical protein